MTPLAHASATDRSLAIDRAVPVTIAPGDGIGPEIMAATLRVLEAAGARLRPECIDVGAAAHARGASAGIEDAGWESIRRTGVLLKGPVTTPQGGGFKSLNVTLRKALSLFANVRPCRALAPFVPTRHPGLDLVIIRENEEDLYAGIEHRQTDDVVQCLKLVSVPGTERIVRYAFEYARRAGRRKVTCMTKDNIMKMTDGLFHRIFREVAAEYPDLEHEHLIVDIGAARLAARPERFDVIVVPNLYGDILSDVAAEIAGSVGLAGSANIGEQVAMFEAIHGTAPDIAGRDVANPSGLLMAAGLMLLHVGQQEVAERVHNAWLRTIEEGVHTPDIASPGVSRHVVGTRAFAEAVIERLGQRPAVLAAVSYGGGDALPGELRVTPSRRRPARKQLVGLDVFVHAAGTRPEQLATRLRAAVDGPLSLEMITNRGVKVWPAGHPETFCTDHWRCRFVARAEARIDAADIVDVLQQLAVAGVEFVKTEHLYTFDGQPGYSLGQGQ